MTRRYVPLWEWMSDFRRRARVEGDSQRDYLGRLHYQVWDHREKNPEHALELCEKGAALARQLREPCMELFHEYWAAEMRLFYLARTKEALDYVTKLVTKASQSQYQECPVRARVYITLIAAYSAIDALSYEQETRDMMHYMEAEMPLDSDTHQRLQAYRARLCVEAKDYSLAEETALQYLNMSANSVFREADAYELLTEIMYLSGNEEKALEYAILCEQKAHMANSISNEVAGQLWQALFHRKRGDEETAQRLFRRGMAQFAQLGIEKERGYYDMMCRFYEAGKEYEKSLAIRADQISKLKDTVGGQDLPFDAHRKRCIVLKQMGRLTPADMSLARDAAQSLRKPEKYLTKLTQLEDDSTVVPLY